jgi:precorrin-3B methylase
VVLARDVGGSDERVLVTDLAHLDAVGADMRTIVLVGASTTRSFAGSDGRTFVYTPRAYGTREGATPMNTESSP